MANEKISNVMKIAGSAILLLCTLIFLSGCVQVIINPPGTPGVVAPVVTPTTAPAAAAAADSPKPAAAVHPATTAAAAASPDPLYIVPVGDLTRVGHREFTFNYASEFGGSNEYNFRIPVNMSVYYGAKQMKVFVPPSSMNSEEIQAYINSFESDPAMEELYDSVLSKLRSARYRDGQYLSDDEYLELIVAFVQQIPYEQNPSPRRLYPIEVIYDKKGDSDEKSLLLANLLAREGYDVAMMIFEDEGYEVLGIRVKDQVPDSSLKVFTDGKKDYVFVDVSKPAFIGAVPRGTIDFTTTDDPAIYPVGTGTKSYGMVNYVWKVVVDLHQIRVTQPDVDLSVIHPWDRVGSCMWIKNKKYLNKTVCYCCDM